MSEGEPRKKYIPRTIRLSLSGIEITQWQVVTRDYPELPEQLETMQEDLMDRVREAKEKQEGEK